MLIIMAGRGGRGSALLKALEEPARKPGAATASQPTASGDHDTPQVTIGCLGVNMPLCRVGLNFFWSSPSILWNSC